MNNIQLGQRIKDARIYRELSLEDLARAVGVNKSTISRYERGEIDNPKLPVIQSIGKVLRTNPLWLIGKSEDKTYSDSDSGIVIYGPSNLFSPLKRMRIAQRRSAEEVAYAIGISKEHYCAIESGHNTDCLTLVKIAQYFCCSIDFILAADGVICEDEQISFAASKLVSLHQAFELLSPHGQDKVISFAQKCLHDEE